jgi:site-specific DNA-methyltransferase (adenine-specific)
MNRLYFGDNLEIMKRLYHDEHQKEFIDLIYIDPPFNSKRNYNVLFESIDMEDTKAQKEAFADTWSNVSYLDTLNEIREIDLNLYNFLNALDHINISKSAVSYLSTMSIRIWYMHKLLKPTGSFYLHCDPSMSHYLKIVCDLIFKEKNFRNEIIWTYRGGGSSKKDFGKRHDIILRYSKSENYKFVSDHIRIPYQAEGIGRKDDAMWGKHKGTEKIYKPHPLGKIPEDWWSFNILNANDPERLGYPTQKPVALLERIIQASSNEGDLVADFFCGCGTTIAAAQKLNRRWIGSDISHLAVKLISKRLVDTYGESIRSTFEIHGFPKDLASARELAAGVKGGRLLFEEWIVEVMLHGILNEKRNAMGFDGHFTFDMNGQKNVALIEVKSGGASPTQLNHFIKTVESRNANMGIFVCFADEVTDNMRRIAKKEGLFQEGYKYEKIQILTVEDILNGKLPDRPESRKETFKQAERVIKSDANQQKLF